MISDRNDDALPIEDREHHFRETGTWPLLALAPAVDNMTWKEQLDLEIQLCERKISLLARKNEITSELLGTNAQRYLCFPELQEEEVNIDFLRNISASDLKLLQNMVETQAEMNLSLLEYRCMILLENQAAMMLGTKDELDSSTTTSVNEVSKQHRKRPFPSFVRASRAVSPSVLLSIDDNDLSSSCSETSSFSESMDSTMVVSEDGSKHESNDSRPRKRQRLR